MRCKITVDVPVSITVALAKSCSMRQMEFVTCNTWCTDKILSILSLITVKSQCRILYVNPGLLAVNCELEHSLLPTVFTCTVNVPFRGILIQ